MRVLRCSYTVLNSWARGDYQDAINSLFKLEEKDTPQIRAGRDFDEQWTEEVKKTGCQPVIFGGEKLENPLVQKYLTAQITPWLTLSGKLDLYHANSKITDWKTGATDAQTVISSHQLPIYAILAIYNKMPVTMLEIHHYNQYIHQPTYAFAWVNPKMLEETANWIETHASELYNYIEKNNLWELDKREK